MYRLPLSLLALALALSQASRAYGPDAQGNFDERIDHAIQAGRAALLRRLPEIIKDTAQDYPVGRLALPLAALLKAGESSENPIVKSAFEKLETLKAEKTYCAALYLLALDGLWKRKYEEAEEAQDATARTDAASLPGQSEVKIKKKMEELVDWLVEARTKGHGSWTYGKAQSKSQHDFSNTQFAVLGLQVGLEHGIEAPQEVFGEVATLFSRSLVTEGESQELELTLAASPEEKLGLTRPLRLERARVPPGGWGYTDSRRSKGEKAAPYPSMTAAGASSLAIALNVLNAAKPKRSRPDAEKALLSGYAWIAAHFDLYLKDGRQLFYTLYSLEKAGDLGRIERFGGRHWYLEGASKLLEKERKDGGWGSYIDTSFALLFLTRATQLFEITSAPKIITTGGGAKPRSAGEDLVYLDRLHGSISARKFFKYLAETRRPALASIGDEIIRRYAPGSREDLAPLLLLLWKKEDAVTSFSKKALAEVTGLKSARREAYVEWMKSLEQVRSLEAKASRAPDEVAGAIKSISSPRLKCRLVALAQRCAMRSLASLLIEELSVDSAEYRRKIHGILELWTGAAIHAPAKDDVAAWEAVRKAWQGWWRANGEGQGREARVPRLTSPDGEP